ncbi:hypothetical protein AAC387_Pa11g1017 [Persea americana]
MALIDSSTFKHLFFSSFLLLLLPLSSSYSDVFESWCKEHGKTYASQEEKLHRYRIFEDNLAFVTHHNAMENSTYTLSLNVFADLTQHEFKTTRLGISTLASATFRQVLARPRPLVAVPASLDWRKEGAVTSVKDQGSCGDCWAFSATGAIEGINKIFTGSLVSLSEQELCDCDKSYNNGCGGGLMDYAFKWVIKNHGIDTEEDYPYKARDGSCLRDKMNRHVVTIDGYVDVPPNNEEQLLQAVAAQPISVGLCGSERAFQLYSKGVFTGPCSTSLDHAGLIIGYGSENGVDYWIMKNSWGKGWGMGGYVHMLRNSGNSEGVCGIYKLASYPTKTGPNPPPSPSPSPTKCSLTTYCPSGSTCCCTWRVFGFCLSWSCCELESAVCCKDNRYCCPHDYPVCDIKTKHCLKGTGNSTRVKGLERSYSMKSSAWNSLFEVWGL